MLGRTAMLEFKDINGTTVLTGKDLRDARAQMTGSGSQAVVGLEFTDEGGAKFADLTARNIGRPISILLDGEVLTSPVRCGILHCYHRHFCLYAALLQNPGRCSGYCTAFVCNASAFNYALP